MNTRDIQKGGANLKNPETQTKSSRNLSAKKILLSIIILSIAGYLFVHFFWIPMSCLSNIEFTTDAASLKGLSNSLEISKTERYKRMRSICNRRLLWGRDHCATVFLRDMGDRTSIPYIIWSMPYKTDDCPVYHCIDLHSDDALRRITNQSPGMEKKDWMIWYEKNLNKSTSEWWVDGFNAAGYPVSARGDDASIHQLFRLLGEKQREKRSEEFLVINALRMLECYDREEVVNVFGKVMASNNKTEIRGALDYWEYSIAAYLDSKTPSNSQLFKVMLTTNPFFLCTDNESWKRPPQLTAEESAAGMLSLLISREFDVNAEISGYTPLYLAAYFNRIQTVRNLLDNGALTDKRIGNNDTPLIGAINCRYGEKNDRRKTDMVLLLLEKGANANAAGHRGNTPLHNAVRRGNAEIVKLLLSHGSDVSLENDYNETALDIADNYRYRDIENTLIKQ